MKILIINGSPKGKTSNSLQLARSFVEGLKEATEKKETVSVEEIHVVSLKIGGCKGCFACWRKTPGTCVIKDDMSKVIEKEIEADVIVWSFPLYAFSIPGILKILIERQLPMLLPFMSSHNDGYGSGSHDSRFNMGDKQNVLISTCGFYSAKGNYDSVTSLFDHRLGKGNYTTIFCGQGELFSVKELSARTSAYLGYVKTAGEEYANGGITPGTRSKLDTLLYPKETFEKMADASWGVDKRTGKKEAADLSFTRRMAALYNKNAFDGKVRVLEICYTDLGTTYQVILGKDGSQVLEKCTETATTRIDTPYDVWGKIARKEITGPEALEKGMYTVTGDFNLLINWEKFFGDGLERGSSETSVEQTTTELKNPSLITMTIPWIVFWLATAINPIIGSLVTVVVVAAIPLIMANRRFLIWDGLSMVCVALLACAVNVTGSEMLPNIIGYLVFGLFWLVSCILKEPLSAAYVKYGYGKEKALKNPLFMGTNYIIAEVWGGIFVLMAIWSFFLQDYGTALLFANQLVPGALGGFTAWFHKWYPAWKARGGFHQKV